jgi:acid stress chaperone HdeB
MPARTDGDMLSTARNSWIPLALTIVAVTALCTSPARAQTTIEVSKITCEQFLNFQVADPRDISVWLSGYFHGRKGNTRFSPEEFNDDFKKLKSMCFSGGNEKRNVLDLAEEMARAK